MLDAYPKVIVLKNGAKILLRPLQAEDTERLLAFFKTIPDEELWFLKDDVSDPAVIRHWIENLDYNRVLPLVAIRREDEAIVANVSLHCQPFGSRGHIGQLRIVVAPGYRAQRLGTWMLLDVIRLAMDRGVEKLVAEFISGVEDAAVSAAYKLDFFKEAVIRDFVKDKNGDFHDLVIMIKSLHREWSDF